MSQHCYDTQHKHIFISVVKADFTKL